LGIQNAEDKKEVFTTVEADRKAEKFLQSHGIIPGDLLVGVSITAGNKIKEWGDEKFKELAVKIADKYNAKILFRGAKADEERIDKVLVGLDAGRFIKEVDFSLEEMPSVIKRLNLYVAVDSGPIYVAHALGVPVIDIIGPVDPGEQPPHDAMAIQVRPPANIKPSSFVFKKPGAPQEHKRAVDSITVDMAVNAASNVLAKASFDS
ncbi:MAG: glycosyltransferase family 9 protein, partial [Patescibacteria group bacterium]